MWLYGVFISLFISIGVSSAALHAGFHSSGPFHLITVPDLENPFYSSKELKNMKLYRDLEKAVTADNLEEVKVALENISNSNTPEAVIRLLNKKNIYNIYDRSILFSAKSNEVYQALVKSGASETITDEFFLTAREAFLEKFMF